jgi:tRNA pseudouridine38-40 synthase
MVSAAVKQPAIRKTIAKRLSLVVEYDGAAYNGFQLQAATPTIQGELERALHSLTGESIRVTGAGRTDSGVHARGQVVSFDTTSRLDAETFVDGLNHYLPEDIAVRQARIVADTFSARRSARRRHYRYTIVNRATRSPLDERFAHRVGTPLDAAAMHASAQAIIGEHDLASFASGLGGEKMSTVRRVETVTVARDGDTVTIDVTANAFLRHQMRSLAGCLVAIGAARMTLAEFNDTIAARRPGLAGPVLPANGLCLMAVDYANP